jgi:hypothetical protein
MALKALLALLDAPVCPDRNETAGSSQKGRHHIPSQNIEPRRFNRHDRDRSFPLAFQPELGPCGGIRWSHRILGYLEYASGLATAGTYATAPTKVQLFGPGVKKPRAIVQTAYASNTGSTTATTNTQVQTGTTKTITPTNTISLIRVMAFGTLNDSTAAQYAIAPLSRGTGLIGTPTECFCTGATCAARHP